VLDLIERHKAKWILVPDVRFVVSYEADPDAFWIYRTLRDRVSCGQSREHPCRAS
jgi:transposase